MIQKMVPVEGLQQNAFVHDLADGIAIQNGEMVIVRWPDGVEEHHQVYIDTTIDRWTEMGKDMFVESNRAYLVILMHGTKLRVYLRAHPEILLSRF